MDPFDIGLTDQIGIAVFHIEVILQLAKRQRLPSAITTSTNFDELAFIPVQGREYSTELFYGLQATKMADDQAKSSVREKPWRS